MIFATKRSCAAPISKGERHISDRFCATLWCSINRYLDFPKVFFCPGWLCDFKGLFIPVWREIHRSKILPVTSWQLLNRKVSDNSRRYRHSICQSFFPAWNYNIIKSIQAKQVDLEISSLARSLCDLMHWSYLVYQILLSNRSGSTMFDVSERVPVLCRCYSEWT